MTRHACASNLGMHLGAVLRLGPALSTPCLCWHATWLRFI